MKSKILTTFVLTSLVAVVALGARAADGALGHFTGSWSGTGKITVRDTNTERIRCRSNNVASGPQLSLSMRCASDSYKFELASDIVSEGSKISGSWNETTRGVLGSLSGQISGGSIQATATAVGVTASLSIRAVGNALNVSIKSPGSEVSEVTVSMAKAGAAR